MILLRNLITETDPREFSTYDARKHRGTWLTLQKFIRQVNLGEYSDCISAMKSGHCIFRGNVAPPEDMFSPEELPIYYVDPNVRERHARWARKNFYNAVLGIIPSWKNIPSRSRALTCTGDIEKTDSYGIPYVLLLKNGSRIAIGPASDFWDCFPHLTDTTSLFNLRDVNEFFKHVLDEFGSLSGYKGDIQKIDDETITADELKRWIPEINHVLDKMEIFPEYSEIHSLWEKNGKDIIKTFDYLLDPQKNKIRVITTKEIISEIPKNLGYDYGYSHEMWTDSPAYMLPVSHTNDFLKMIIKLKNRQKKI